MSILNQRKILAMKVETVSGTAESLTSTQAVSVFEAEITPNIPHTEREAYGTLGKLPSVVGTYGAKVVFKVELQAVKPAWWDVAMPGCAIIATSGVYRPTSNPASMSTVTFGLYEQGETGNAVCRVAYGCMGTVKLEAEDGKPVMLAFDFDGIWGAVTDASMLTVPAFPAVAPRFAGATFTIASYTPKISKFSFDAGNTIGMISNIAKLSGYQQSLVTARAPKGKIDPYAVNVATSDVWGQLLSGTTQTLSLAIPDAAGNVVTLAAPALQYRDIKPGNRDKLVITDIDYELAESAGDDSFSFAFTAAS